MASHNLLLHLLPLLFATLHAATSVASAPDNMFPFACVPGIIFPPCEAKLYHFNRPERNLQKEQIAAFYSVAPSQLSPITHGTNQDFLITTTCSCSTVNGVDGYFYDAPYLVKPKDTFSGVSDTIYSGQAWDDGDEQGKFIAGNVVPMHLLCGCAAKNVVTYTVQAGDTLASIATLLSSSADEILRLNKRLISDPHFIDVGWVLYVPSKI